MYCNVMCDLECNICYNFTKNINELKCCNSEKHICNNCLKMLKRPVCPYCLRQLPEDFLKDNIACSIDTVYTWNDYLRDENIIFEDQIYEDSRRLRRQMRRLRYNYMMRVTKGQNQKYKRSIRRLKRRQTRDQMNEDIFNLDF